MIFDSEYIEMLYVLPYGQMSLWGATVITNLLSAIPVFGQDIVELNFIIEYFSSGPAFWLAASIHYNWL